MSVINQQSTDCFIDSDNISIHSDDIPNPTYLNSEKIVKLIFYKNGYIFNNEQIKYYNNSEHKKYLKNILKGNLPKINGSTDYKLTVVNYSINEFT